jgi:WD40 repeat protein
VFILSYALKNRKIMKRLRWHGGVTCLAISPDNRILASGENSLSSKIILWDIEKCRMRDVLEGHQGPVETLIFTKNGKMLISRDGIGNIDDSKSSDIFLWNLDMGRPVAKLQGHKGSAKCTIDSVIDDDEKFLVGGGSNGILIWDLSRIKEMLKW